MHHFAGRSVGWSVSIHAFVRVHHATPSGTIPSGYAHCRNITGESFRRGVCGSPFGAAVYCYALGDVNILLTTVVVFVCTEHVWSWPTSLDSGATAKSLQCLRFGLTRVPGYAANERCLHQL